MGNKNLVIVPFAYLSSAKTGANIKKKDDTLNIYLKNVVVSTVSCKRANGSGDIDVALVTNLSEIDEQYQRILDREGIHIFKCPFDAFKFPDDYEWCLAFYKLCALKFACSLDYENILLIDSDTYVRGNFDYLWQNMSHNIILYDRAGSTVDPKDELCELHYARYMYDKRVQRVGGEFLAASKANLTIFIEKAEEVFRVMMRRNICVKSGDEYISSITAATFNNIDFSGIRYIYRFETGFWRERCNKGQLSVTPILHVPGNKKTGMIKLYNYYVDHNAFPPENVVYKWFHFYHRTFKHFLIAIARGTLFWG